MIKLRSVVVATAVLTKDVNNINYIRAHNNNKKLRYIYKSVREETLESKCNNTGNGTKSFINTLSYLLAQKILYLDLDWLVKTSSVEILHSLIFM